MLNVFDIVLKSPKFKKILGLLYTDILTVKERAKISKPNGSTGFEEVVVLENQPCKLSFSSLNTTNQNDATAQIVQVTKLFCDNEINIKPGSKIIIQRDGETFEYSQSGLPGIFPNHQEIVLVPFEKYA